MLAKRGTGPDRLHSTSSSYCYDIYSYRYSSGGCCGDEATCLRVCDDVCGVPAGTCVANYFPF